MNFFDEKKWKFLLLIGVLFGMACAHPISDRVRQEVNANLDFARLIASPEQVKGEMVVLGGQIVQTRNIGEHSEIEVIQKPLDFTGYPSSGDETGGRFIFVVSRYLESEIYSKDRLITGAGKVSGGRVGKVGDTEYQYPVIAVEELHLWEKMNRYDYYDPFYPYYPYYYYPRYYGHFGHSRHFLRYRHY